MANLTQAQRLIWTGQQLDPDAPLYNMALRFRIAGPVDPAVFQQAFDRLVGSTDALRTVFPTVAGEPVRQVLDTVPTKLNFEDLTGVDDREARLAAIIEAATVNPLDLSTRLFDSGLVTLGDNDHVWWIVQHHLITDGWATAVVFKRMSELYGALTAGELSEVESYPQFEAYAQFEERFLTSDAHAEASAHWEQQATAELEPLTFYGVAAGSDPTTRTDRITVTLSQERMERLQAFVERTGGGSLVSGVSLFNVFATVLTALLYRITGQSDLAILAPAHNRPSPRFKNTAGLFIEVLPLHVSIGPGQSFTELLDSVGAAAQQLLLHARPGSSAASHNRAASVLLNLVNASLGPFHGWPVETEWIHPGHGDRDHALRIQIHDFDESGRWTLHFDLRRDVFDDAAEERLIRDFHRMFDALIDEPDRPVSSVDLFSEEERNAIDAFNVTEAEVPFATVVEGFTAAAHRQVDAPAIRASTTTVTYGELDEQTDRLARHLNGLGGDRFVVCMRRSPELVVALLGILKAGASYVPLDTKYPAERMRVIIEDSGATAVIADESLPSEIAADFPVVRLPVESDAGPLPLAPGPADLAYVMYTSGSTGKPKGVMVTHRGLANYVAFAEAEYGRGEPVSFPLYSSVGFDLTVTSIFTPLVSGGTVVVYPDQEGADLSVIDVFTDDLVDVVKLTPAHLALLDGALFDRSRIRTLILGGEDLKRPVAQRAWDASGGRLEIINEYGPTEATVGCMLHRFDPAEDAAPSVPIGRPARNARIHILDSGLGEVPVGVVGELCIGGTGVADGYLNRPDRTAASFVPDPFRPGEILYRTGDLARWVAPGQMEFLGRADDQVKVRGHRIELGDVEAALRGHPEISDVVVDVLESETVRSRGPAGDRLCVRCGLTDAHPDAQLNDDGVCRPCLFYDAHRGDADAYFSNEDAFEELFADVRRSDGEPDCLMLLSGGKDSTYALYQLVEHGLTPLVFSLDNGYISEGAKANIRRAVDDLGLELVWGTTPAMNEIFADSLGQFSNVCQGCFKTVYTLGIGLAHERGVRRIVTGLSRGQIFETRLADLFRIGITDPDEVDTAIIEARKAYHRMDDAVFRCLDTGIFQNDAVFEEILLVDFYRYFDVGLGEIYDFLGTRAPWVRPSDTGRSTNCLINNTGIFVHKNERGFHNYALPYSWDVRLGHKTRDAALAELDDEIDVTQVRGILDALPYEMKPTADVATGSETRLVGFYVAEQLQSSDLRRYLAEHLPDPMIPSYLVRLDEVPLTINGKVDRRALPDPRSVVLSRGVDFVEPRTDIERQLADIWSAVLGVSRVGVTDDFFELGGDSILNIQIVSQAKARGLQFTPLDLFRAKTIEGLARAAVPAGVAAGSVEHASGLAEIDLSEAELDALLRKYGEDG